MDTLTERVLNERIRILQARLTKATEQRDRFAKNYHEVTKVPHQERYEIINDCDFEIEWAGRPKNPENGD